MRVSERLAVSERLVVLSIVAIAFATMGLGLADEGLWLDEAYGYDMAFLSWPEMARITRDDAHPPLYYAALSLLAPFFGSTEFGLRFPSVISALLAVPFAYLIGQRVDSRRGALAAALAIGFSPFLQYYAREVRMYAPLVTVAVAATYGLLRLVERPGRPSAVAFYAATVAALLYTHYFGPLLVAAHGGALIIGVLRRQISRGTLLRWAIALGGAGALFTPWAVRVVGRYGAYAGGNSNGTEWWQILIDAATGFAIGFPPSRLDQLSGGPRALLFQYGAPMVLVALAIVGAWPRPVQCAGPIPALTRSVLAWAAALPPVAVSMIFGERQEIAPRYLAVAVAPLAILAALGALRAFERSRGLGAVSGCALLAVSATAIVTFHRDTRVWRDDFRSLASFIAANAQPGQIVVGNAGYIHRPLRYYLGDRWPIAQIAPRSDDIARQTEALARSAPFVWLAVFQEYYADPEASARGWLDAHAFPRVERRFRGNLRLIGYSTERPIGDVPRGHLLREVFGGAIEATSVSLRYEAGRSVVVDVDWRALGPIDRRYTVFVHVLDPGGARIAQFDGEPVAGRVPTTEWPIGRLVYDQYRVRLPESARPGQYQLLLGLYDARSGGRLRLTSGDALELSLTIPGDIVGERGS